MRYCDWCHAQQAHGANFFPFIMAKKVENNFNQGGIHRRALCRSFLTFSGPSKCSQNTGITAILFLFQG